ncbi:MAG: hypothetical protein HYX21_01170 [Candidatus Yanofskybacteria bacterium]|nr:hypothetical protein [Candidatus Yanofskybacteria bacterium]
MTKKKKVFLAIMVVITLMVMSTIFLSGWQQTVFLRVALANGIASILIKTVASSLSRTKKLSLQFFTCFILSLIFGAISTDLDSRQFNGFFLLVIGMGLINSGANYCQWRAMDMNVTKTSLFTQGDDILSMVLAYFILNESRIITLSWSLGIVLVLIAAVLFVTAPIAIPKETDDKNKASLREQGRKNNQAIWKWVMGYNLGWGLTSFMFRVLSLNGLSIFYFLPAWYGSSFIGSLFILFLGNKEEASGKLTLKNTYPVLLLSLVVFVSLGLFYQAFALAEVLKVRPIFQMGQVMIPLLVGLYVFNEFKDFTKQSKLAMIMGLIGTLVIFANI